jgi:protein gp37
MATSSIEWTNATWNPVAGCTVLSPGCTNCYAMRLAARLEAMGMAKYAGLTRLSGGRAKWTGAVRLDRAALAVPAGWKKPRMIFVNSMSDLFWEAVPEAFVAEVWAVMARTPQHTYQILTKRPERMEELTARLPLLPNVWLGTSVENAEHLFRLDHLRRGPAAVRFLSLEPLLSSLVSAVPGGIDLRGIDWAIAGGESGPGARPVDPAWVREIRDACRAQGTAFFFKQRGGTNKKKRGRLLDGRTWDEFPQQPCAAGPRP